MLELHPDIGEVHLARPATAATTRSALEAIKKKFELAAAAANADVSEKLLLEKGKETKPVYGSVGVPSTPDGTEHSPAKPPSAIGLIDSRGCAKPTKKGSSHKVPRGVVDMNREGYCVSVPAYLTNHIIKSDILERVRTIDDVVI
uniref:Uncharacterized protein n=1 Tax=Anopheles culicifacies TaxID=139723 RepID=A0A182M4C5_9DIPT